MQFIKTKIPDLIIIKPTVYEDKRGYFLEAFNLGKFNENICEVKFLQDKYSKFMPTEGLAYESKLAIQLNQRLK